MTRRLSLAALALTACGTAPTLVETPTPPASTNSNLPGAPVLRVARDVPLDGTDSASRVMSTLGASVASPIEVAVTVPDAPHGRGGAHVVVGRVSPDGRVDVRLPAADALWYALVPLSETTFTSAEGCRGDVTASRPDAGVFVVTSYLLDPERAAVNEPRVHLVEATSDSVPATRGHRLLRVYADRETVVTGTLTCPYLDKQLQIHLREGWNVVREDWTSTPERLGYRYTTPGEATSGLAIQWFY